MDLQTIHEHDICTDSRIIWLNNKNNPSESDINHQVSIRFIKNLSILSSLSSEDPITIILHSCGGCSFESVAIFEAMRINPCPKIMMSYVDVASAATMIIQGADVRVITEKAGMLLHRGSIAIEDNAKNVSATMKWIDENFEIYLNIYANRMKKAKKFKGKSLREIKKYLTEAIDSNTELYLTSKEAKNWGLIDKIL